LQRSEQQDIPLIPPRRGDGYMVPPGVRPVLQNTALEFLLWGVRNMEPFQLLSVNSPSILIQVFVVFINQLGRKTAKSER